MQVQIYKYNNVDVASSRIIADELNKRHSDVIRDIEVKLKDNANLRSANYFIESYYQINNRNYREYLLTQDGFIFLVFNYNGYDDFKMAYIQEFNRLKEQEHNKLPTNYKEALIELVSQVEVNEKLQLENSEMKPKVDYMDTILQSKALVTVTSIAKDYGMSAQELNIILHDQGIQYELNKQWFLYAKYHNKGYTQSKTFNAGTKDNPNIKSNTYWTQKGRKFIHEVLKELGIKPNVEQL